MKGYLGPAGTFSYMAAKLYNRGETGSLRAYPSIYDLLRAAEEGEVESCIVPIENSIEGGVNQTLDSLAFGSKLYITGEITVKISENLIAKVGCGISDIKKIISHPQPIGQCAEMIKKFFPDRSIEYTESTAAAAKIVASSEENSIAMIGPAACADIYGLKILIPDCQTEKNNKTRFVEVGREAYDILGADKTSFVFAVGNRPGSLLNALRLFYENNVNMIKIESRPGKKQMGEYIFFVDTDGSIKDDNVKKAWEEITRISTEGRFLGSYKKG